MHFKCPKNWSKEHKVLIIGLQSRVIEWEGMEGPYKSSIPAILPWGEKVGLLITIFPAESIFKMLLLFFILFNTFI